MMIVFLLIVLPFQTPVESLLKYRRWHSSYYSINGGKVDLINQLPAPTMPCSLQFMTEATSMTATALGKDLCLLASACLAKDRPAYDCNERQ